VGFDHKGQSTESPYLAFLVALHVATALALLVYFRSDWLRIIGGFLHTLRTRKIETPDERMAWLLVVATIPTGILGLAFEHNSYGFAKPLAAAVFLTITAAFCSSANGSDALARARARRVA